MQEQDFLKHYIQNARQLMWFIGVGTSRSAQLPPANDIIWDLKLKYYCAQENQEVKAHDINNKAIKSKIQSFLGSRKFPAFGSPEEYSYYFNLVFGNDRAAQQNTSWKPSQRPKFRSTLATVRSARYWLAGMPASCSPQTFTTL